MTHVENEQEIARKEAENIVKNYTRTENMLIDGYPDLLPQEKWLCICLKRLCGAEKTRFLSLRYIAKKTGFSVGSLAACKKTGKPGMIRRLHDAGLIHAEIKKRVGADGTTSGNEQYHITITDIWQLNYDFYYGSTCSESEHLGGESESPVQNMNATCSEYERNLFRNCNNSKITTNNITTSNKETYDADASLPHVFSDDELLALLRERGYSVTNQPELSTPASENVDKSPEQVATSNPIASDTPEAPTQHENGSHEQPASGKKPRPPAKPLDDTTKARVERVFSYFDKLKQEMTDDSEAKYVRTKTAIGEIKDTLLPCAPTEQRLRKVYMALWNTPRDARSGFEWKKNMTIKAVCGQYEARVIDIIAEEKREAEKKRDQERYMSPTAPIAPVEDDLPFDIERVRANRRRIGNRQVV